MLQRKSLIKYDDQIKSLLAREDKVDSGVQIAQTQIQLLGIQLD